MFDIMKPENVRINDQIEYGLGTFYQDNDIVQQNINFTNYDWLGGLIPCARDSANNNWRWCSFSPMLGLFQQDKFLPIFAMGSVTLELELANDFGDCVVVAPDANADFNPTNVTNTSSD